MTIRQSLQNMKLITSSDLDIVATDNKTRELYNKAATTGAAPGNSCKIQILGDERAGKTSLRKKLMGERFDPEEPSTFGIDTRMCKVNEIDGSWRERRTESVSEYDQIMSWVLADRLHKWRKSARASTTSVKTWLSQQLVYAIAIVALYILISGIILLSVVLSPILTASTFCYGLIIISALSVFITQKSDVYRVGVGVALAIPLTDFLFRCLFAPTDDLKTEFRIVIMIAIWISSSLLHGFVCGVGLRTGAAAAALLLNHPTSVAGSICWQEHVAIIQVTEILIC